MKWSIRERRCVLACVWGGIRNVSRRPHFRLCGVVQTRGRPTHRLFVPVLVRDADLVLEVSDRMANAGAQRPGFLEVADLHAELGEQVARDGEAGGRGVVRDEVAEREQHRGCARVGAGELARGEELREEHDRRVHAALVQRRGERLREAVRRRRRLHVAEERRRRGRRQERLRLRLSGGGSGGGLAVEQRGEPAARCWPCIRAARSPGRLSRALLARATRCRSTAAAAGRCARCAAARLARLVRAAICLAQDRRTVWLELPLPIGGPCAAARTISCAWCDTRGDLGGSPGLALGFAQPFFPIAFGSPCRRRCRSRSRCGRRRSRPTAGRRGARVFFGCCAGHGWGKGVVEGTQVWLQSVH